MSMPDIEADEFAITAASNAMGDIEQLACAVHRLCGSLAFPQLIAELVLARRQRNSTEANRICAEIMWQVEDNVMHYVRRHARKPA